tara:strand:- start:7671 stop:7802 length:132 start_codon:yes stop_codon:yes gene_type:complete
MKNKKYTSMQRILRLENIVSQLYIKLESLKIVLDKYQTKEEEE